MPFVLAKRFVIFLLLWLAISRGEPGGLAFGLAAAALAAGASLRLLPPGDTRIGLLALLGLLPGFLWRSVLGGVDVARRAFDPRLPLKPGWIACPTSLPPGLARVSLGSEMSLLPGSLVAGGDARRLYLHCLDTDQDIAGQLRAEEARIVRTLRPAGRKKGA